MKLQIAAGKATPAPPVGPALGQAQINIMEFCKQFNARTSAKELDGLIIPVVVSVYSDRTFTFITKTPPASILLKRAAGVAKGSGVPNKDKVGKVTEKQVMEIAKQKMPDLNAASVEAAIKSVKGTARSMGIEVTSRKVCWRNSGSFDSADAKDASPPLRMTRVLYVVDTTAAPEQGRRWETRSSMKKSGKNVEKARAGVEKRPYTLQEAVPLLQKVKFAKFDETVDLTMRLGVDPKHADQMVRGTVILPHGLGKTKKVLVIASGEKQREAEAAGADFVGGEDMVEKIQKENWTDYDAVIATPDMMKSVGRLGKVLGPRGLMPNPKTGTVTFDVAAAVKETKAGKVEFRTDKTALVHVPVGKISFEPQKLVENAATVITSVIKAKPSVAKGKYIKGCYLSSTMGPGVAIDTAAVELAAKG